MTDKDGARSVQRWSVDGKYRCRTVTQSLSRLKTCWLYC